MLEIVQKALMLAPMYVPFSNRLQCPLIQSLAGKYLSKARIDSVFLSHPHLGCPCPCRKFSVSSDLMDTHVDS